MYCRAKLVKVIPPKLGEDYGNWVSDHIGSEIYVKEVCILDNIRHHLILPSVDGKSLEITNYFIRESEFEFIKNVKIKVELVPTIVELPVVKKYRLVLQSGNSFKVSNEYWRSTAEYDKLGNDKSYRPISVIEESEQEFYDE